MFKSLRTFSCCSSQCSGKEKCFFVSFSKSQAVPQETFLMKGEMFHEDEGDVHSVDEVFLSYGITTDASLWLLSPETCDEKTHEEASSHHSLPHHLHIQPAALDGAQEWKKKVESKCSVDQAGWETLVQEVVTADQSLACILYPVANRKTAIMLMEQMLSEDNLLMEDHYKKKQEQKVTSLEQNTFR